jgi:hypothetical protein
MSSFNLNNLEVKEPFASYWQAHGGLATFGLPIEAERNENGLKYQYFERARFEYHPEAPDPYKVQLGLVGVDLRTDQAALMNVLAQRCGPTPPGGAIYLAVNGSFQRVGQLPPRQHITRPPT